MSWPHIAVTGAFAVSFGVGACGNSSSTGSGSGGAPPFGGTTSVSGAGGAAATGGTPGGGGVFNLSGAAGTSTGGGAGMCNRNGEQCTTSADCCDGAMCHDGSEAPELNGCHTRCIQNSDCTTGCCYAFSSKSSAGICADAKWCSCGMNGARCGTTQPKCCDDQFCLAGDDQKSFYECKPKCTMNADCATNCCVQIPSLMQGACLDPQYCP